MSQTDLDQHIEQISTEAGLAVMVGILHIVRDRETVRDDRLFALTADDLIDMYDSFVGPAVDGIEDQLA